MNEYTFPVWGTQGGGLVRRLNGKYIFVEAPEGFPEILVGSEMHPMWDLIPANNLAHDADDHGDQASFNAGVDEFFDAAFELAKEGKIPLATIGDFFPDELKRC